MQPLPHGAGAVAVGRQQRGQATQRVGRNMRTDQGAAFQPHQNLQAVGVADLGHNGVEDAVGAHHRHHRRRVLGRQQLEQFIADAFGGQLGQTGGQLAAGVQADLVGGAQAVMGVEAEKPQDTQHVFFDPGFRVADETHPPSGQIGNAVEGVPHPALDVRRQGVDGEIAPRRIVAPGMGKGHAGMTAIGFHIPAQGGDFVGPSAMQSGDGAVGNAGGQGSDLLLRQQIEDGFRLIGSRHVDIGDLAPHQRVANAAADEPDLAALGTKRRHDLAGGRVVQPILRRQLPYGIVRGHRKTPVRQ